MLGQVLRERYELQEHLSTNPGRKTFLARDLPTEELVILKLISFGNDFTWQDFKLFEREAETLQSLSHPAIPSYLDSFEIDLPHLKCFAIVQTYIPGKSLDQHLKDGRVFSECEIKEIAKSLLNILIYLHGHCPPVIHRDIKPSNIILTNRSGNNLGNIYLVDFGSVQTLAAKPAGSFTVTGTYGYMPPEQFGGRSVPASDLYALGGTLIYLVTGIHPGDLPQKDLKLEFEPLAKNLSRDFIQWLKLMTEPSLDRRVSAAEEAVCKLEIPQSISQKIKPKNRSILSQPVQSNIVFKSTKQQIQIIVPSDRKYISQGAMIIAILGLILLGMFGVISGKVFVLLSTILLAIGSVNSIISSLEEKILVVNQNSISLTIYTHLFLRADLAKHFRLLGHKARKKGLNKLPTTTLDSTANIRTIALINCIHRYSNSKVWYQTIELATTKHKFVLTDLTMDEGIWLASELSDWLSLPIEMRSQTT